MRLPKRARARLVPSTPQPIDTNQSPSRVIIGELSDHVLLNIFRHFLEVSPRHWPKLVHICRKWRHLVFEYQQSLQLRLFCTHGTPVKKILDCWPASLPIVVEYGGSPGLDPPARSDEVNIVAALQRSDRVRSISLTVTNSLLRKLSSIIGPFSQLEDLVLMSRNGVHLTVPSAFLSSQCLRRLHSTGIAIPALIQPHHSSMNLIDFQLHKVRNPWDFSPEALPNALSRMTRWQLRSLSLHFLPTKDRVSIHLPSSDRVVLPVLTCLNYRGMIRHLENILARIDAPRLEDIEITFSHGDLDFSKLAAFIDRIEMHKYHQAHILLSEYAISISLMQPGAPTRIKFHLFCEPLSLQLSSIARIFTHFSALLLDVEDLFINATRRGDSSYTRRWLEPLKLFGGVKWLHVVGNLSTDIVHTLQLSENVLPTLHGLHIPQPGPRHVPLREVVVSFMTSRRLSGRPIAVEYERLSHMSKLNESGPFSQQATVETLSEDILLNVFHCYLSVNPELWPMLTWVCQRWRQIVFTSPLGLNLRLHCTYGTPVLKTLDCWPALPIIVQYGGVPNLDPPSLDDDDNIVAALKHSDRVRSICLTVTGSLLEKLSVISEPFSELEELTLLSQDNMQLTLPTTFQWGSRLRTLVSTRIAFPTLPQLLLPCWDLEDLQLHEFPSDGHIPPEALANALSGMTQLRSLSLHLLSFLRRRSYLALPPLPGERIVLPALTCLKYRGASKYLDSFVARIDAPRLSDINIMFFNQPTMDASQLGRFIERTDMQTSLGQAEVEISADAISISFTDSEASTTRLRLQISSRQLGWQLFCMAQICHQFSPFFFRVKKLGIGTAYSLSDGVEDEQWLELVLAFSGTEDLRMAGGLATNILRALYSVDSNNATVLPSLRSLRVEDPGEMDDPFWDTLQLPQRLSRNPAELQIICHLCNISFRLAQLREFKKHLDIELFQGHAERMVSVGERWIRTTRATSVYSNISEL